jgi:hypothetical protein
MHGLLWRDVRLLGALTALGLDALCPALGVVLAAASLWLAAFPLFGGITGLVAAPLAGWRYGRAAAFGQPMGTWAPRAIGFTVAIGLALWCAYDVAGVALLGVPGGPANFASFVWSVAFESIMYVVISIVVVTIPLGCFWACLMRRLGRGAGLPLPAP